VYLRRAAAREAGRAMGTAPDPVTGTARAQAAARLAVARLAVADQSVEATDVRVVYAPAGAGCDAAGGYAPTLTRGEEFSVCVTVTVRIPLLPQFVDANTATGQFLVERDRYVDAGPFPVARRAPAVHRRARGGAATARVRPFAVTSTPADTGTGSTRTRSVRSSAGSFQCCPLRLLERAVRLLLRRQRRHRLVAVSWHSSRLVSPIADPLGLLTGGRDAHPRPRAATGPLVPEGAAVEHPCRRVACAWRRRRRG
jgi:hypothetical protein